jgi:hypothetical protein
MARRWDAPSGYQMWAVQAIRDDRVPAKVRLWYRASDRDVWEIGHSKTVPEGMSVEWVIDQMVKYTTGVISQDDYNTIP